MNLCLESKLLDIKTNSVVGLLYRDLNADFPRLVPFRLQVAKDLGLQDSDIAEYMDVEIVEVVVHNNSYAIISNALCELEDKAIPYERINDDISIWGYVFNRFSLVSFINSLEEADYGEDKLC